MANPYHDENGKFCSRDEMKFAIDRLAKANDLDGYFNLRQQFQLIEDNKALLSVNLIKKVSKSEMSFHPETAEEIRELAGVLPFSDDSRNPRLTARVLSNPECPEDIREEILQNASVEDKAVMADVIARGVENIPLKVKNLLALAKDETDINLLTPILDNRDIPFETRVLIARQSPHGLARLASTARYAFFAQPELEKELITNAKKYPDQLYPLAFSPNPETQKFVIDNADATLPWNTSPVQRLLSNEKLNKKNVVPLLENIANNDLGGVRSAVTTLSERFQVSVDTSDYRSPKGTAPARQHSFLHDLQGEIHADPFNENLQTRAKTRQAIIDSYDDNYKTLVKSLKPFPEIYKRNPMISSKKLEKHGVTMRDLANLKERQQNAINYTFAQLFIQNVKETFGL
jgi:hypothetical protein